MEAAGVETEGQVEEAEERAEEIEEVVRCEWFVLGWFVVQHITKLPCLLRYVLSDEVVQQFSSGVLDLTEEMEDDVPKWNSSAVVLAPIYGEDEVQEPHDGDDLIVQRDERPVPVEVGAA